MIPLAAIVTIAILIAFVSIGYRAIAGVPVREALRRLLCRVAGHRRDRHTVRKTGSTYLARCRVCGIRMTRQGRAGEWQVMRLSAAIAIEEGDAAPPASR